MVGNLAKINCKKNINLRHMKVFLFTLVVLLTLMHSSGGDLTLNSYPDVIKCGNHFYYIGFSTPALSRYYAAMATGA